MSLFNEKNLTKWVVILPILSVVVTAFVFVLTGLNNRQATFKKEIELEQIKLLKQEKQKAMDKVQTMASFLTSTIKLQRNQAREDVRGMVNLASDIIRDTYRNSSNFSDQEIIEKIKENLRDIIFWDGTGYFFIYDFDGKCILLPPKPSLENKNLYNLQDAKGQYTIRESIRIVKEFNEGFQEWYWYKPNEDVMKKKIGFIKGFTNLNLYIGTARYDEDIINNIKKNILYLFKNSEKRFFIYDKNGKSILHENIAMSKQNISLAIKGGQIIPEGFFANNTISIGYDIEKELQAGTFFLMYVPEYEWIIGTGTYEENIIERLKQKKLDIKHSQIEILKSRIIFAFIIMAIMLIITIFFSSKLKQVLMKYQKNLLKQYNITLKQQEELTHNLKHDYLTSLPNRLLLTDRLEQDIKHFKRTKKQVAVIFIDVDKFKIINDSLGHNVGDSILKEIACRLKHSIRDTDTVARFGGDEFVILIDDFQSIHDIIKIITKIQKSFTKEIKLENSVHNITLSMGISIFPNDGNSVETLLKNADIAMYKAKDDGGDGYRFFTSKMNDETQKLMEFEKELRIAVKEKQFVLHYQPLVESKSGKILGVEALIRWNHPTKGLIFPDQFINIAEQSSVIINMGQWIVHESMKQMSEWKSKGYKLKKMSINVAIKQLERKNFVECIKGNLEKTSCKAEWLEIEIIERFAMKNITKSIEILNEIRKLNIDIAIDDFGTGHSSLAYLKQLPITKLKIDRAFVSNILNSYEDKAIAESIIALGTGLNIEVLAEGIETEKQREFFAYHNCKQMQGYLFSKPLPALEVEELLKKGIRG